MSDIDEAERMTQTRVITLFTEQLGYDYIVPERKSRFSNIPHQSR